MSPGRSAKDLQELLSKRSALEGTIASMTTARKKLRQMRGAAAHKRVWYYDEQIAKAEAQLSVVIEEITNLEPEP